MPTVLGIDLGTANTASRRHREENDREALIVNPVDGTTNQGNVFPSYVEFDLSGRPINVGKLAWRNAEGGTTTIVWGSKRLIGLPFEEARRELRYLHYPISAALNGGVRINVGSARNPTYVTPEDIAALILDKVKIDAQNRDANPTTGNISRVVVSHPAKFDPERIKAIKETTQRVFEGIPVTTVTEPVAAAMAYGVQFPPENAVIINVIDWGAGTLDVVTAVLGVNQNGSIYNTSDPAQGKANLGGLDMDELLMDWAIKESGVKELEELRQQEIAGGERAAVNLRVLKETRRNLEDAKIRLSNRNTPQICQVGTKEVTLTREKLEAILEAPLTHERLEQIMDKTLTDEDLKRMMKTLREVCPSRAGNGKTPITFSFMDVFRLVVIDSLILAGYNPPFEGIEHILLVGGPMHMPYVRRAIKEIFRGNERVYAELEKIDTEGFLVNPMECVARGAALFGEEGPPPPPLNRDYLIPYRRTLSDNTQSKPVYLYKEEDPRLLIGDAQGTEVIIERTDELGGGGHTEVDIALIEGNQMPGVSADPKRRKWLKKGSYHFYPTYNSKGEASYTMKLRYDDNGISCTCHDNESGNDFHYPGLEQKDGAEVELQPVGDQKEMDRDMIEQLDRFAPSVNIKADVWLTQKHEPAREQHRPEILQLKAALAQAHAVAPRPDKIKWEKNDKGDQVTRDPNVMRAWGIVLALIIKLDSFWGESVSDNDIQEVRNRAQYLFSIVGEVDRHPEISTDKKRRVKSESQTLERVLRYLPESFPDGYSEKMEDVARYKEAKTRCETLRAEIENALKTKLPD